VTSEEAECAPVEPEDLGIKVGSKEEQAWTLIKKRAEEEILQGDRERRINEAIVFLAEKMIAEEKEKFK
jgi:hypothetical protein